MAEVLRTGISVRQREVHIERPNGSRGIALVDIEAIKDSDGNVLGAINCFRMQRSAEVLKTPRCGSLPSWNQATTQSWARTSTGS
jgi:hypothetical protein